MVGWLRALNPLAFIRIKYTTTRLNETFEALYLIAQCCYLQIFGVGLVFAKIKQLIEAIIYDRMQSDSIQHFRIQLEPFPVQSIPLECPMQRLL